ncbi:MAG: hypothetical protein RR315_07835 [Oscillospiraceae bacterium]
MKKYLINAPPIITGGAHVLKKLAAAASCISSANTNPIQNNISATHVAGSVGVCSGSFTFNNNFMLMIVIHARTVALAGILTAVMTLTTVHGTIIAVVVHAFLSVS